MSFFKIFISFQSSQSGSQNPGHTPLVGGGGGGGPNSVGYGPPDDLQSNPGSDPPPLTNVMSSLHGGGDNGSETGKFENVLVAMAIEEPVPFGCVWLASDGVYLLMILVEAEISWVWQITNFQLFSGFSRPREQIGLPRLSFITRTVCTIYKSKQKVWSVASKGLKTREMWSIHNIMSHLWKYKPVLGLKSWCDRYN